MAYQEKQDAKKGAEEKDEDILKDARQHLKECLEEESDERAKMLDDLRFCTLDQWPADIRKERENDLENGPRPCLTIDKINQYLVQVVNDVRQGKPGINVRPQDDNADVETAKVLKGLVRNIEDQSNADIAYATAVESAARGGLGFLRVTTEYVSDDSFDQEIFIRPIPNFNSTYLSKHIMPDGSDAERGYILEPMPVEKFKEMFPGKKCSEADFEGVSAEEVGYWRTKETITVAEEFCIKRSSQTLYFLADGTTISKDDYDNWPAEAGMRPSVQDERTTFKRQLKWRKLTALEVLEKRDLPGKYIPIVECVGREAWVDGKRVLWGLVRPAKDSLRMYNYFASAITEKMGLAPKTPYIGAKGQFENLEEKWKKANRLNYPYLEYNAIDVNGNAIPAPMRQGATPIEAALLQQMQVIEHDVQTSLGMFKAATGESESQQSGRAILALQRESDTGTYHFGANLGVSIRQVGRIIVDLIPHYYDTKRIVRILGEDGEVHTAQLDPEQQVSHRQIQTGDGLQSIYNPGVGKYDVSITVGPSYNTKRMEDQALYVEMSKGAADPASAAVLRYLVMRNSDNPGSQEASRLLKALMPPQALQAMASNAPIPPQVQAQMAQMQQKMAMMQEEGQKLQEENVKLKSGAMTGMAKVQADSHAAQEKAALARAEAEAELSLQKQKQEGELALQKAKQDGELQLAREKAAAEVEIKHAVAAADCKIADDKLQFDKQVRTEEMKHKTTDAVPQVVEMMSGDFIGALEGVVKALADVSATNRAAMEARAKPKNIKLGGIQYAKDGSITGASATVQ